MTKHLITPSLISSFQWYLKESFTKTEAEQRQEFLQTLRREKTEPNEAMQRGIDFENSIKEWVDAGNGFDTLQDSDDGGWNPNTIICEIADIVEGGLWQQTCKKSLQVGNQDFLLYGRTDVIKRDTVFDIKFTSNYELGKFQDSSQHLIYLYCSGLPKFSYLVSNGEDWWREDYFNHSGIEGEIKSKVSEFLDYLEGDKEAKELYFNNWGSK